MESAQTTGGGDSAVSADQAACRLSDLISASPTDYLAVCPPQVKYAIVSFTHIFQ